MSVAGNKAAMQAAFAGLAHGDGAAFAALMDEDFSWTVPGTTPWSRTYAGRQVCIEELFRPLYQQFAEPQVLEAFNFVAEGEVVVVEARSQPVRTRRRAAYANTFCYICRFEAGRLRSVHEYLDTAAMAEALEPPPWAPLPAASGPG